MEIFNNLVMFSVSGFAIIGLMQTPPPQTITVTESGSNSSVSSTAVKDSKAPEETQKLVTEAGLTDGEFAWAIHHILVPEGGWSNHPNDRGGATKYGIIESVAKRHGLSVANISKVDAIKIYYKDYWLASGADKHPRPLNLAVLNSYVNSGRKWDFKGSTPMDQAVNYIKQQDDFYKRIYENNPSQEVFARGWHRRSDYMLKAIKGEFPKW